MYWPVSQLLDFLKIWHPISSLSLKQLTIKTLALIALSSSDRGQTLHMLDINKIHFSEKELSFIITSRLKTTRRILKPKVVKCISTPDPALNVFNHVKEYLARTSQYRSPQDSQLFISWATKRPVTKPTLARWLKIALKCSGIDTTIFSAHSYRGSSLSSAFSKGVNISDIISAGNWTNQTTFFNHYFAHSTSSPIGQIILSSDSAGMPLLYLCTILPLYLSWNIDIQ